MKWIDIKQRPEDGQTCVWIDKDIGVIAGRYNKDFDTFIAGYDWEIEPQSPASDVLAWCTEDEIEADYKKCEELVG